jgi:hypothetical protein
MKIAVILLVCFLWFICGYVAAEVAGNKRKDKNKIPFKEDVK